VTSSLPWLAILFVALVPIGRSGLPLNAQWGDLLFPFVLLLTLAGRRERRDRFFLREDILLGIYIGVTGLAAAASPHPFTGVGEVVKQIYGALIFLVFRELRRDGALTLRLQTAYVTAVAALTTLTLCVVFLRFAGTSSLRLGEVQVLPLLGRVRRLRGFLEAPEFLGNALLVAFLLALALRLQADGRMRMVWMAVAAALAAFEFLTYSHSVAGFAVAAAWFITAGDAPKLAKLILRTAAVLVVIVVNLASVIGPRGSGGASTHYEIRPASFGVAGIEVEGQLMSYAALKEVAWTAFQSKPLLGVGPAGFPLETEKAFSEGRLPEQYRHVPPHSAPAGRLAETGFLGGLSLLALWVSWLVGIRRGRAHATVAERAMGLAIVGLLVNGINADIMNFRFLWLALAWAIPQSDAAARDTSHFTRA
jgi:hypothetical protein